MELDKLTARLQNRTPTILGSEHFSKFAVLLPLIRKNNDIHILFEVRALTLRRQPGEICFPGGKVDESDSNEQYTAIRETSEELGIHESNITNIFPLDYIVSPFGTIIHPYVGVINNDDQIQLNTSEVAEIFTVPLSFFQEIEPKVYNMGFKVEPEEPFPYEAIIGGENYNWQIRKTREYFYYYEDKVIWGLTAKILHHFLELLHTKPECDVV
ncbi:NUDIX hydrolase [Microbacteriaceae bacterium 4G12]